MQYSRNKSDAGFSLIEVLIAVALISTMAIAFASFTNNQLRATSTMQAKLDMIVMQNYLIQALGNDDVCTRNVLNREFEAPGTSTEANPLDLQLNLPRLYSASTGNQTVVARGDNLNGSNSPYTIQSIQLGNIYQLDAGKQSFHADYLINVQSPTGYMTMKPIMIPVVLQTTGSGDSRTIASCGSAASTGRGEFCGLWRYNSTEAGIGGTHSGYTAIVSCGDANRPMMRNGRFDGCPDGYRITELSRETRGLTCPSSQSVCNDTATVAMITCIRR